MQTTNQPTDSVILCACGCGQPVKKAKYPSQQRRFINTHQHKGENNGNYRNGKEKRCCPVCNETFEEWPSQVGVTCGKDECYKQWQRLTTTARGKHKIDTKCAHCGKVIKLFPSQMRDKNFCSRTCLARSGIRSGNLSGQWKGGRWTYYKRQTLMRDNYRCVICGFDISVDVHHITPIAEGGKDEFSNLISLCPNHHRMAHLGVIDLEPLRKTGWEPAQVYKVVTKSYANRSHTQ